MEAAVGTAHRSCGKAGMASTFTLIRGSSGEYRSMSLPVLHPVLHPVLGMEEEQGIPDRKPDDPSSERHADPLDRTGLREPLEELSHPSLGCQKQRPAGEQEDGKRQAANRRNVGKW